MMVTGMRNGRRAGGGEPEQVMPPVRPAALSAGFAQSDHRYRRSRLTKRSREPGRAAGCSALLPPGVAR